MFQAGAGDDQYDHTRAVTIDAAEEWYAWVQCFLQDWCVVTCSAQTDQIGRVAGETAHRPRRPKEKETWIITTRAFD